MYKITELLELLRRNHVGAENYIMITYSLITKMLQKLYVIYTRRYIM